MTSLPLGKRETTQLGVRIRNDLVEKVKQVCESERRPFSYQLEMIIEEWFEARKKTSSPASSTEYGTVLRERGVVKK